MSPDKWAFEFRTQEAGLSGQTCLAACVLGAVAIGNFVEKLSGLGEGSHPE